MNGDMCGFVNTHMLHDAGMMYTKADDFSGKCGNWVVSCKRLHMDNQHSLAGKHQLFDYVQWRFSIVMLIYERVMVREC